MAYIGCVRGMDHKSFVGDSFVHGFGEDTCLDRGCLCTVVDADGSEER